MNTNRTSIKTVLVGSGRSLSDLLATLFTQSDLLNLDLIAVVDLDESPDSPLPDYARQIGIPLVTPSLPEIFDLPRIDLLVLAQDDPQLETEIRAGVPEGVIILGSRTEGLIKGLLRLVEENRTLRLDSRSLKETRLRLNMFIESATLAIYVKDKDLRYRKFNSYGLHLLGLRESEIIGKTDHAIYPDGSARWLQNVEQETLRTGKTLHATGMLPARNRQMHVQITLFPLIEGGRTQGLYGLIEDTTELFQSEQKLHEVDEQLNETQKYLREVLENSQDMIFLADPEGNLLSFNSGAEKVLGYSRDEVVGTPANRLCSSPGAFDQLFVQTLQEGHTTRYEAEFRSKELRSIICNISLTLITSPDGLPLEIVCLCRDITTRLRLKNDLIRTERLAAVGQMAAGVAHEINNPLAVIDTIAGLVEETIEDEGGGLDSSTRQMLAKAMDRLHYQVKRVTNITHSLLGFVRNPHAGVTPLSVNNLLDESLNLLAGEIHSARTTIERQYADDLPQLTSDPLLLQQVFVNLVKNALDAIAENAPGRQGCIEIQTNADGNFVTIAIQDNGVGIPKDEQDKIFNLFHTTKPVGKGTGLGLSIVHDILYRLGGSIRVASEPGNWSRFTVELPLDPPELPLPDPSSVNP